MKVLIKEAAEKFKGWTLYRLASQMGKPQQTIYSWANCRTQPGYGDIDLICHVLGCKTDDLFEAEPPREVLFR